MINIYYIFEKFILFQYYYLIASEVREMTEWTE